MAFPIIGAALGLLKGGPAVSELVKLDKEAQRDFAQKAGWALIILSVPLAFIGIMLGIGLAKLIF